MADVMMKCGHSANAKNEKGEPSCAICIGIHPGAEEKAEAPNLVGRKAECPYCETKVPSSLSLAFFEHRPGAKFDSFYCGCYGWD